jgi:hypothetical protein
VPRQLILVVLVLVMAVSPATRGAEASHVRYAPPVDGRVLRAFDPPSSDYGPGHRGVDLQAVPGETVRAAADGTVAHAGAVAGTTWVSLDHADGVRTSYGPLDEAAVSTGQPVARGAPLGRLAAGGHGPQRRDRGLHLGARRDGAYIDPMVLLRGRPSLVGRGREDRPRPRAGGRAPADAGGGPVDGPGEQSLPSRHGPPSMVGLLHVKTTHSTRPPTGGPGAP